MTVHTREQKRQIKRQIIIYSRKRLEKAKINSFDAKNRTDYSVSTIRNATCRIQRMLNCTRRRGALSNRKVFIWIGHGNEFGGDIDKKHICGMPEKDKPQKNDLNVSVNKDKSTRPIVVADCLELLKKIPTDSIDGILLCHVGKCMNVAWVEQSLRVIKSGGYIGNICYRGRKFYKVGSETTQQMAQIKLEFEKMICASLLNKQKTIRVI